MLELIKYICGIALIVASLTDLKKREVADWLNYALIAAGFGINLIASLAFHDPIYIISSLIGFAISFVIAYVFFYAGLWGGGDSKMTMGLGALIGVPPSLGGVPFLGLFYINILVAGALYGVVWVSVLALLNWKKVIGASGEFLNEKRYFRYAIFAVIIFCMVALLAAPRQLLPSSLRITLAAMLLLLYLLIYFWAIVSSVEKKVMVRFVQPDVVTEGDWIVDDIALDTKVFLKKGHVMTGKDIAAIKSYDSKYDIRLDIKRNSLLWWNDKSLKLSELKEGDVIVEPSKIAGRIYKKAQRFTQEDIAHFKQHLRLHHLFEAEIERKFLFIDVRKKIAAQSLRQGDRLASDLLYGHYIAGPKDLGIEMDQLEELIALGKKGKIKEVRVKYGIPFIPSFLIAFIYTAAFNSLMFLNFIRFY